jgi:hypothetical protein
VTNEITRNKKLWIEAINGAVTDTEVMDLWRDLTLDTDFNEKKDLQDLLDIYARCHPRIRVAVLNSVTLETWPNRLDAGGTATEGEE